MSSSCGKLRLWSDWTRKRDYVEIDFIEIAVRMEDDVHVVQAGNLQGGVRLTAEDPLRDTRNSHFYGRGSGAVAWRNISRNVFMGSRGDSHLISRRHRFVRILWCPIYVSRKYADEMSKTGLGVDVCDFLYSASLSRPAMLSRNDTTIRTLTQFFDELVLRVDDEGRVKGGEGVPLHVR